MTQLKVGVGRSTAPALRITGRAARQPASSRACSPNISRSSSGSAWS